MYKLRPELVLSLKNYSKNDLAHDFISGIIVAIIALPLSIALALASGVSPEQGLYTAIVAGFLISALGGSKVQISGPTAAFATIVAGVVVKNGMDGLALATIMAGIILILMGIFKMGSMIKYIPSTITVGFTAGIAMTILIGQLKDFLGLTFTSSPIETIDKLRAIFQSVHTINYEAFLVGLLALSILIFWTKISKRIPASLVAVIATGAIVKIFSMDVNTIGDLYTISSSYPKFHVPNFNFNLIVEVMPDAITIAILAAIESLLSAVVADEMIGSVHNSNMELVAQGVGNSASALFGGIPATGAIARTAANIKNGGKSPISGMVHAIVLLLILVLLMPYATLIPMPCIAAILFQVAYNMSGWRIIVRNWKYSPKSDFIVLIVTFFLTVIFNLVIAILIGMTLACLLFMKRMAEVSHLKEWDYVEDSNYDKGRYKNVPQDVKVYEFSGPMFFGAADKLPQIEKNQEYYVVIIRMKGVPAIDVTALKGILIFINECNSEGINIIFSHVNEQPMNVLKKAGIFDQLGSNAFQPNIDDALDYAKYLINKKGKDIN